MGDPIGDCDSVAPGDTHKSKQYPDKKISSEVVAVHVNVFLYAFFFWMQQGVYPQLSRELGADSLSFDYLQCGFAFLQLIGGPVFGRYADVNGGKAAMTMAFSAASASYGMLAYSDTKRMLFLSRIPTLFMHVLLGGQMIISDQSIPNQRVRNLGRLSLSYGLGMGAGPTVGSWVSHIYGQTQSAVVACLGSMLSIVITRHFMSDHSKPRMNRALRKSQHKSHQCVIDQNNFCKTCEFHMEITRNDSILDPRHFLNILSHSPAVRMLVIRLVAGIPIGVFQSIFPHIAMDVYHFDASQNTFLMTYIAIVSMVIQGAFVGYMRDRYEEVQLIRAGIFSMVWSYLAMIWVTNIFQVSFQPFNILI